MGVHFEGGRDATVVTGVTGAESLELQAEGEAGGRGIARREDLGQRQVAHVAERGLAAMEHKIEPAVEEEVEAVGRSHDEGDLRVKGESGPLVGVAALDVGLQEVVGTLEMGALGKGARQRRERAEAFVGGLGGKRDEGRAADHGELALDAERLDQLLQRQTADGAGGLRAGRAHVIGHRAARGTGDVAVGTLGTPTPTPVSIPSPSPLRMHARPQ